MLLRKDAIQRPADPAAVTLVDVKAQKSWPTLWAYMTQLRWEDDTPREPSGLTLFVQDGMFKVLLKDNATSCVLWSAGTSFFGALDAIEAALAVPQPDWRMDRRAGGGVAKKGKK